jgi:hypothetical protein
MDSNGDGALSYAEFKRAIGPEGFNLNLSQSEQHDLAVACDLNGDGTICLEEFALTMMESNFPDIKHYFQDSREELVHRLKQQTDMHAEEVARLRKQQQDDIALADRHGSHAERAAKADQAAAKAREVGLVSASDAGDVAVAVVEQQQQRGPFAGLTPEQVRHMYLEQKMRSDADHLVRHRGYEQGFNHHSHFQLGRGNGSGSW